jgi:hypothetical protein
MVPFLNTLRDNLSMYVRSLISIVLFAARAAHADVELNEQARNNFGINTTTATTTQISRQWHASAQVLDASMLVISLADLRAAQAAATASSAELQRLEQLHKEDNNVALKTVETARAQAVADSSHVQSLQAQLLNTWGVSISRMQAGERERLAQALVAGDLVLIRAELNNAPTTFTARSAQLKFMGDDTVLNAKVLGALPQIDAQSLGKSYLLSAQQTDGLALQPGQVLSTELQDAARTTSGTKLPRAAVLRWQGRQWAYVEIEVGHYRRVPLTIAQWLDDAALVTAGIKTGDKVVTTGAGLLLGAELKPASAEEE